MKAHGDTEAVNLSTGERLHRVSGEGESKLESNFDLDVEDAWKQWASERERDTTWRRDRDGTPGNMSQDEFLFKEGFRKGIQKSLSNYIVERFGHG